MYLSPEGRMLPCMALSGIDNQKDIEIPDAIKKPPFKAPAFPIPLAGAITAKTGFEPEV